MLLLGQDYQEGAGVQEYYKIYETYEMYKMYEMYEMYESTLSQPVFPLIPPTHNGSAVQKRIWSPSIVSTYDGLTYDRANSFALQATMLWGTHGRAIVNNAQPVINNTSAKMTGVVDDLCGR